MLVVWEVSCHTCVAMNCHYTNPGTEEWYTALWSALLAAHTNEFVKQSVAMNRHCTNPDRVLEPPAAAYYAVTASSDQQQVVSAKGIAALCLAVVVIGAFPFWWYHCWSACCSWVGNSMAFI